MKKAKEEIVLLFAVSLTPCWILVCLSSDGSIAMGERCPVDIGPLYAILVYCTLPMRSPGE